MRLKPARGVVYGFTALLLTLGAMTLEDTEPKGSIIYPVDDDRDGRTDRYLILERSDSLA